MDLTRSYAWLRLKSLCFYSLRESKTRPSVPSHLLGGEGFWGTFPQGSPSANPGLSDTMPLALRGGTESRRVRTGSVGQARKRKFKVPSLGFEVGGRENDPCATSPRPSSPALRRRGELSTREWFILRQPSDKGAWAENPAQARV